MSAFWSRAGRGALDECWLWSGARTGAGYGVVTLLGREVSVHRLAWELERGPIPVGMSVLHRCDVRHCCNPAHLFLGSQADNIADMVSKRRQFRPEGVRHHNAKLCDEQVIAARQRRSMGEGVTALAREYGVSPATMCDALRGRTWSHV